MFLKVFLFLCFAVNSITAGSEINPLGPYKVTADNSVTISGLSSGGYMAVQMHMSFSSIINGSAIFAAGPYYCAEGTLNFAEHKCMKIDEGLPNVSQLVALTADHELYGFIDHTTNLRDDKVFLYSGKGDTVVAQAVVSSLQNYYQFYVKSSNIVADYNEDSEHCLPTINYGEPCLTLSSPYIGDCNYDGAEKALKALYGNDLKPRTSMVSSNLKSFNQTPYIVGVETSLADVGFIYVPTACADGKTACHLHVSLHGCLQNFELIGNQWAANIGLNEWAESNNIIILYPYAKASSALPLNPNGCWDWWGYTNEFYGTKNGVQTQFLRRLIKAVTDM